MVPSVMSRAPMLLLASALLQAGCDGPAGDSGDDCLTAGNICTLVGIGGSLGFNGEGLPAHESMLYWPTALRFAEDGRVYVADFNNWRIRELTADGLLRTVGGDGQHQGSKDGMLVGETSLDNPIDLRFLPDGSWFVLPLHEARVARVDAAGVLHHYVGTGFAGFGGDGGPAADAQLSEAAGIDVAADGTLYIADTYNHCIRYVTPDGTIHMLSGLGLPGYAGDGGPAEGALYSYPGAVHLHERSLYVADSENHVIRRIDLDRRTIETVAGLGAGGYTGDGGPATGATLSSPQDVIVGPDGALWIADSGNNVVRRVGADGVIETVAGDGEYRFAGDGGPAREASFGYPVDLVFDGAGTLYVSDMANGVVRFIPGAASW